MRTIHKALVLAGALALAAVLGVAWLRFAPRRVPAGQAPLATLDPTALDAFRDAFDERADTVRLLVMLSPT